MKVEFYGWTDYNNTGYPDFDDLIDEITEWKEDIDHPQTRADGSVFYWKSRYTLEGKESILENLNAIRDISENILIEHCKEKGIKFNGMYHQNGDYGTPLFKVIECDEKSLEGKIIKFTCTFRYWGGIMTDAGFGEDYVDWAWMDAEEPVYPSTVKGENCIPYVCGRVADAYDPEFDVPMGD